MSSVSSVGAAIYYLLLDVIHERISLVMLFVRSVFLTASLVPTLVFGEEGIGLLWRVVNLGKAQSVGKWQGLLVHTGSTYYIYIFVGRAVAYCLLKRAVGVAAGETALCATNDDVATVGQGTLGKRLAGTASHNDCVASS